MSRANTYELVGACAIVKQTRARLMLSDKLFRFVFRNRDAVDTAYLDQVLKSPSLRAQIIKGATGTSPTMKNISKEKVLGLLIPSLPIAIQKNVAAKLDAIKEQIDAVAELQMKTIKELDAMLPASIDGAIHGKL